VGEGARAASLAEARSAKAAGEAERGRVRGLRGDRHGAGAEVFASRVVGQENGEAAANRAGLEIAAARADVRHYAPLRRLRRLETELCMLKAASPAKERRYLGNQPRILP